MDTVNTVILYFYCFRFARLLVILVRSSLCKLLMFDVDHKAL